MDEYFSTIKENAVHGLCERRRELHAGTSLDALCVLIVFPYIKAVRASDQIDFFPTKVRTSEAAVNA
jgi:hypothetical protein